MFNKILVCLDGSELAEQIIPYAWEQAKAFSCCVVFVHVIPTPVITSPGMPGVPDYPIQTDVMLEEMKQEITKGKKYLNRAALPFKKAGFKTKSVILEGSAGEQIVQYADKNKIELIAIATHGRSGLGRFVFGSVADFILRQSGLPVLVVKSRAASEHGKM